MDRVSRHARWASVGRGKGAVETLERALEPFDGAVDELLASLPRATLA